MKSRFFLLTLMTSTLFLFSCSNRDEVFESGQVEVNDLRSKAPVVIKNFNMIVDVSEISLKMAFEISVTDTNTKLKVNWGDGHVQDVLVSDQPSLILSHDYDSEGQYFVVVNGDVKKIKYLSLKGDEIINADLRAMSSLKALEVTNCGSLSSLDLSGNVFLESILLDNTSVNALNFMNCNSINDIFCINNKKLASLNLGEKSKLTRLCVINSSLVNLPIEKCLNIKELNCSFNRLDNLNIDCNTNLESLDCSNNNLKGLSLLNNKILEKLDCSKNLIKNLDVSCNKSLTKLWVISNSLGNLNIENNLMLDDIIIASNPFSTDNDKQLELFLADLVVNVKTNKRKGNLVISKLPQGKEWVSNYKQLTTDYGWSIGYMK